MDKTDPRERSDRYRKHMTVKFINAKQFEFAPTQFLIDENYVGNPPKVQISFENLNDNIDENFLRRDLEKLGRIRTIDIVRHPETRQHLGLARVQFEDPKVASCCVETFNGKQVMGKQLSVYHDVRFTIVERRKEEKVRPQPVINHIETPKLQVPPTPILPVFAQIPFPPVISPNPLDVLHRPINRQHTSLDERLAKLGLKQAGAFPSVASSPHLPLDKGPPLIPFLQNHVSKSSQEKRLEAYPPARTKEDEDKLWNPDRDSVPSPSPSPVEKINLTKLQKTETVFPYIGVKFLDYLRKNLFSTLIRRLKFDYGYPDIDEAQRIYRLERDHERSEKAKKEALYRQKLNERRYFNKDRVDTKPEVERPKFQVIRQRVSTQHHTQDGRTTDNDLRRVNRSAALVENFRQRQSSEESKSERSYRYSRSPQRRRISFGSRSNSRSSRESSSSFSRDSSVSSDSSEQSSSLSVSSPSSITSHETSSSSRSSEAGAVFKMETSTDVKSRQSQADLASAAALEAEKALEAATALASLNVHPIPQTIKQEDEEPLNLKPIPKKRKKKDNDQENHDSKRMKTIYRDENELSPKKKITAEDRKPLVFNRRSRELVERMNNDLYSIDEEDLKYLKQVHQDWEEQHESTDQTRVPFGSEYANRAHLISFRDLKKEIESKTNPRWWNGCSRCSMIETSDRGKVEEEEMTYEDLTKAPIKSHVILGAVSTRRDQRSDQRRIAALNPEIDPAFLKQFTANTLQMRAKNLRFSRSKIHQWGLFACEKISNGDAVIEYVGEKIRASVADHRELVVYPSLPNHDGSSYFFRVDTDVIDASFKGNKARFINHSCNPNCIAKIIKHENGTNSIVIYAKQTINEDEEITYDYKFPREANAEDKIRCNCKAPRCHVWLN